MTQPSSSVPYLEGVAKLRYALSVTAQLLYHQQERTSPGRGEGMYHSHGAQLLLDKAKECCSLPQFNKDEARPAIYLVKLLARQYGLSFLTKLTSNPAVVWVVPEHLRRSDKVSIT